LSDTSHSTARPGWGSPGSAGRLARPERWQPQPGPPQPRPRRLRSQPERPQPRPERQQSQPQRPQPQPEPPRSRRRPRGVRRPCARRGVVNVVDVRPGLSGGARWLCGPYARHLGRFRQAGAFGRKDFPAGERIFDLSRRADFAPCMVEDAPRRGRRLGSACLKPASGPRCGTLRAGSGFTAEIIGDAEAVAGPEAVAGRGQGACCRARRGCGAAGTGLARESSLSQSESPMASGTCG
jgi:hypothetical protein